MLITYALSASCIGPDSGRLETYKVMIVSPHDIDIEEMRELMQSFAPRTLRQSEMSQEIADQLHARVQTIGHDGGVRVEVSTASALKR